MAIGELTDEDAHLYGSVDEDRIFRWIMDVAARLAAKLEMPAGNFTVLNTVFNLMVKCLLIRLSVVVMTHSTPSSLKLGLVNTSQELFFLILSQDHLTKSELVLTDNFITLSN